MVSVNGSTGAISISGGANVTVGNNASTVTVSVAPQTVQTQSNIQAIVPLGNTVGTTGSIQTCTVGFAAGNNITLSQSSGAASTNLTIIGPTQTVQTQNLVSIEGSTGNIDFANANNVTFGFNASTITASASFPAQTVQTQNVHNVTLSGNTAGAMAHISSGTMTLAGGNNITLSQNGNAVTISGANPAAQTNQTIGIYGSGNTSGTSTGTLDARSLTLQAQGSLTVDMTNGRINLSAPNALTTAMASNRGTDFVQANAGFNGTNASGTIASNAISVSVNAQTNQTLGLYGSSNTSGTSSGTADARSLSVIARGGLTADMTNGRLNLSALNVDPMFITGNTSGNTQSITSGQFALAGGNNITLSQGTNGAGNTITISAANQTNQSLGIYASSNTTAQSSSSTVDARSLTVRGAGIVSAGMSGGELVISATGAGGADGVNILAAGTQTANTTGTVLFANSNGLSFGMSNSSVITGSYTVPTQTIQTQNMVSVQGSTGAISFGNANGITFGGNASTLTASHNGITSQTNQTIGIYGSGNTSGTSTGTLDARSLTVNVSGSLSVNMTNGRINLSAPNALTTAMLSNASTQFVQANANFNGTNATGTIASNNISVSVAAQTNQTVGLYAVGNTTQNSSTTRDARSISFNGLGNLTVGYSNGSVQLSGSQSVQTQSRFNLTLSGNTAGAMAQVSSGTLTLAGGNNITLSQNGNAVTISAPNLGAGNAFYGGISNIGNTSGTSGTVSQQLVLAGGNNVTLSQSTNGNSATVTISAGAGGGGFSAGMSTAGETWGTTGLATNRLVLAGTNGIYLSQSTNGGSNTLSIGLDVDPMYISGNTSGTTASITAGDIVLAGGNNITLSQSTATSGNTITISSPTITYTRRRSAVIRAVATATAIATGEIAEACIDIPPELNGWNVVSFGVQLDTAGSSSTTVKLVRGRRATATSAFTKVDVTSTSATVDTSEFHSKDGTTATINTANDDMATGDRLLFNVTAAGTGALGMVVYVEFELP
jgi:hypothetical protein